MQTDFEVIVVGAGHAGCEAALASARMGCRTAILTVSLDNVALMACNPSIGGPGKGHLVREIDALGGEMGRAVDRTYLQIRMLNTAKGRAVRALRAQSDKGLYHATMKAVLERQENLFLREGMVTQILTSGGRVSGVLLRTGEKMSCQALILATGTFLGGEIHIGAVHYSSGPSGFPPSQDLPRSMAELGLELRRFKTGTSPRVNGRTVALDALDQVDGDLDAGGFSFWDPVPSRPHRSCWLTHTTSATSAVVRGNLNLSAMYGGGIRGVGPRYCPSIESKIVEFPGRDSHPVFIEPEGEIGEEMYLSGLSTSLPLEIQYELLSTVPGLENARIMRPGYAIEYDVIDSTRLGATLEDHEIGGLFCAGQLNGSSGYEEAAAQGLMAGVNAALGVKGLEPLVVERWQGYIGVLIDDLTVKGVTDPYRMLTARAEHRLLLREGNADLRLTELGHRIGLIDSERFDRFLRRRDGLKALILQLEETPVQVSVLGSAIFDEIGTPIPSGGTTMADLLRRPEVEFADLQLLDNTLPDLPSDMARQVEDEIKYRGYIERERMRVERRARHENRLIPPGFDYKSARGLSREAVDKLSRRLPRTIGEAARVPGISPADLAVLEILIAAPNCGALPDQPEGNDCNGL